MDDFYAECDEHLGEVRKALLHLEPSLGVVVPDSATLLKLFHSFHSLKGIFGMAGLQVAESLAHRTEDFLRSLGKSQTPLEEVAFDALSSATERLEQTVVAHREGRSLPDISGVLDDLGKLIDQKPASRPKATDAAPNELAEKLQNSRNNARTIWLCSFEPSQALSQQGKSIRTARACLEALGEILHCAPKVEGAGRIEFEFIVAGPAEPGDAAKWQEEGIRLRPYDDSPPSTPAPAATKRLESIAPAFVAPSHIVRVDLTRLDELMRIMGDLVVHRARLEEISGRISTLLPTPEARSLQEVQAAFGRELRNLRDGLMRVRLVSVGEIFQRMPFVVRDLARESGKKIRLVVTGQETEIDKYLVERLKDPLLHLVRNAVCHGIESPEERMARDKPAEATITLRASTVGECIVIEVSDDGRGIDEREVQARARERGLVVPEHPDGMPLLELICQPGFSTRDEADRGAGRGMGMTAVQSSVLEMGGQLSIRTQAGTGTTFALRLPLTLAIADALIIAAGGQRFAVPQGAIQEITTAESGMIKELERNEVMTYRNGVLPLIRLSSIFELTAEPRGEFPVLVIGTGLGAVGVAADRLLGQREIVIRPVNDPLLKVPAIAGATELGDGRAVLILDAEGILQSARSRKERGRRRGDSAG